MKYIGFIRSNPIDVSLLNRKMFLDSKRLKLIRRVSLISYTIEIKIEYLHEDLQTKAVFTSIIETCVEIDPLQLVCQL